MTRYELLKQWMKERNVSFVWLAAQLGIKETPLRRMLMQDRIPTKRHAQLVRIGIPEDMLPPGIDLTSRRPVMIPLLDADGRILQVLPEGHDSTME